MTESAAAFRIVPYERLLHGDGPWRVVASVFEEYGFPFDEGGYDQDVLAPDIHYNGESGWFWVAVDESGAVAGCVGLSDEGNGEFELHRLYVDRTARGNRLGERFCQRVIGEARARGARRLVLFSDIHFTHAHGLYERCGWRVDRFRYAPDPWQSREWGFVMEFTPTEGP